jgi:hypothetical protein
MYLSETDCTLIDFASVESDSEAAKFLLFRRRAEVLVSIPLPGLETDDRGLPSFVVCFEAHSVTSLLVSVVVLSCL